MFKETCHYFIFSCDTVVKKCVPFIVSRIFFGTNFNAHFNMNMYVILSYLFIFIVSVNTKALGLALINYCTTDQCFRLYIDFIYNK